MLTGNYFVTPTNEGIMNTSTILNAVIILALAGGVAACKKPDEQMGPAQKAGAAIDNAGEKVADKLHENLDKARQAADQANERARNAGDEMGEAARQAAQDASKGVDKATDQVGKKVEQAGEKIQDAAR
jgi:hypothetical protein